MVVVVDRGSGDDVPFVVVVAGKMNRLSCPKGVDIRCRWSQNRCSEIKVCMLYEGGPVFVSLL